MPTGGGVRGDGGEPAETEARTPLGNEWGYVLDYSNASFADFVRNRFPSEAFIALIRGCIISRKTLLRTNPELRAWNRLELIRLLSRSPKPSASTTARWPAYSVSMLRASEAAAVQIENRETLCGLRVLHLVGKSN